MSPTTLVVGATGALSPGVVDLARDWSALGLVQRVAWIDEADIRSATTLASVPASILANGTIRRVGLGEYLADQQGLSLVRLLALSSHAPDACVVDQGVASRLRNELQGAYAGRVVPLHCIVTRHGAGGWQPQTCWLGWHNLVLAPEEAWDPQPHTFAEVLEAPGHDDEFVAHATCGLLSLAGLWTGMEEGPFDATAIPPQSVRVTRAFVRRLDVGSVAREVRNRIIGLSEGLPRPWTAAAGRLEYIDDAESATKQIADGLRDRYSALFRMDREVPRLRPAKPITLKQAVKYFFGFLAATVKGAPKAWLEAVVASTASRVAGTAQRALFGDDPSLYRVTVLGRDGEGRLKGIDSVTDRTERIASTLRQMNVNVDLTLPDLGAFWRDFVGGALTLADGGQHVHGIEPVQQGAAPGVLRDTASIVPPPDRQLMLGGAIAARVHSAPIDPTDAFTARRVRLELEHLVATDPALGAAAAQDLERLQDWFRPHAQTFAGRIGDHLARCSIEASDEIDQNRAILEQAAGTAGVGAQVERAQVKLARRQRWLVVGLVVALVAIVAGVVLAVLAPLVALLLGLCSVLGWFGGALWSFMSSQRELFKIINARERDASQAEVALRNLGHAVADLNRMTVMYTQFVYWAAVAGVFLAEPFGRATQDDGEHARVRGLLTRSFGLGIATADTRQVDVTVERLSARLFSPGWLATAWDSCLASAPERLGRHGVELMADPTAIYRDKGREPFSVLRLWASSLRTDGVDPAIGAQVWTRAKALLVADQEQPLVTALLGDVEILGQERRDLGRTNAARFLGDLAASVATGDDRPFHLSLFQPRAQAQSAQAVRDSVLLSTDGALQAQAPSTASNIRRVRAGSVPGSGLDQFVLLVQSTDPVAADMLTLAGPSATVRAGGTEQTLPTTPSRPDLGF